MQCHLHEILTRGETLHIHAFQVFGLFAYKPPLQVVKFDSFGLHVGRVLQVELVLGWVGVEQVGADEGFSFGCAVAIVLEK